MSEPRSWLEEGAPRDVEQLLLAAQAERPGEASLARALIAVGIGLGASSVAGGAGAAGGAGVGKVAAPITVGLLAKWGALGAVLGTVAAGVAAIARHEPPAEPREYEYEYEYRGAEYEYDPSAWSAPNRRGSISLSRTVWCRDRTAPADRFIAATAIVKGAALVTADSKLLEWKHRLQRHDAAR
jgi:predicted nucleic acid-binding protein